MSVNPHQEQPGSLRIFQFRGINVYLHWSWAIVAFIAIQRGDHYASPVWNVAEYLGIFGIVLLHEFGHALACRSVGGQADRILLWPLGGIAFVRPPQRPGAVLWSIVAGPLVNVVLLPITWILLKLAPGSGDLHTFLDSITMINLVILIFNLLPIYPLDGGQIVQSILWYFVGQFRSLRIAATIGLIGAVGLVIFALWLNSIWFILIAVFGASRSYQGLMAARQMTEALNVPRHKTRCPACRESPPVGNYWQCYCGNGFDPFASQGRCHFCSVQHDITACPLCGAVSPLAEWGSANIAARPVPQQVPEG